MSEMREHLRPPGVRALDDDSRRLVRPAPELLDERTQQLHDASTIPERSYESGAQVLELRSRQPERVWLPRALVDDVLRQVDVKRAPAPVDVRGGDDPPTMPDRTDQRSSDVFQSIARAHTPIEVDLEGPTPQDRPPRLDQRPTELDMRHATPTATYHAARDIPVREESSEWSARDRRAALDTTRERALVDAMYDSERKFIVIEDEDPRRAEHILSLKRALETSPVFSDRDRVLAIHVRQKLALNDVRDERRTAHEDQVIAIGLVARELDNRYRDTIRELREQLVDEIQALPADKREAVYTDFDSFMETDVANDSHFCRREMHEAMNKEMVLHRAYVYALALDDHRARSEADAVTLHADNERSN